MHTLGKIPVLLLRIFTTLCLIYALFASGILICTTPQATNTIGKTFSSWNSKIFPEEDMATIAEATRNFSIEGTDENDLKQVIEEVLQKNYPQTYEKIVAASNAYSYTAERYTLTTDAITHLQDCTPVFQTVRISIGVVGVIGLVGVLALFILRGRRIAGKTLCTSAIATIAIIAVLGTWAAVDFDSLFTLMHSAFFAEGTWLFDSNSLLIQLFPEAFWTAMAFLWGICSIILCIIVSIVGKIIRGRK